VPAAHYRDIATKHSQYPSDRRAEKFIRAATESQVNQEDEGRLIQTPVRLPKGLLTRIDAAAKKRGLNRSSWLRYAATKELDQEER